jgi:hypothetical protein
MMGNGLPKCKCMKEHHKGEMIKGRHSYNSSCFEKMESRISLHCDNSHDSSLK